MRNPTRKNGRRQLIMRKVSRVMKQRGPNARGRDLLRSAMESLRSGQEAMAKTELKEFLHTVEDLSLDHRTLLSLALSDLDRLRLPYFSWLSKAIEWIVQTAVTTLLRHIIPSLNYLPAVTEAV